MIIALIEQIILSNLFLKYICFSNCKINFTIFECVVKNSKINGEKFWSKSLKDYKTRNTLIILTSIL